MNETKENGAQAAWISTRVDGQLKNWNGAYEQAGEEEQGLAVGWKNLIKIF